MKIRANNQSVYEFSYLHQSADLSFKLAFGIKLNMSNCNIYVSKQILAIYNLDMPSPQSLQLEGTRMFEGGRALFCNLQDFGTLKKATEYAGVGKLQHYFWAF